MADPTIADLYKLAEVTDEQVDGAVEAVARKFRGTRLEGSRADCGAAGKGGGVTELPPVPRHRRNPRRSYDENGQENAPPTIGSFRAEGDRAALLSCNAPACRHEAVISTDSLPDDLPFPDIVLHARCSQCGSRNVSVMRDMGGYYRRLAEEGIHTTRVT